MPYNYDYEILKYIDKEADNYVPFKDFLKNHNTNLDKAWNCVKQFKEKFNNLLSKYSIGKENLVVMCYDLIERISEQYNNPELHYLYFCIMTDVGLINEINSSDHTKEQEIRIYFQQKKLIQELSEFLEYQIEYHKKIAEIREYLKKPRCVKNIDCKEETDFLYHLTIQHTFLYKNTRNAIYKENLNALLIQINSDEKLKVLKPYIIYSVLTRKQGVMRKRKHFLPNLKIMFQYQNYNIYKNNGKNFNLYQSELELYDHLQRSYADDDDVDIKLCDFFFANLSPLSEWYYIHCEPNENIPMNIRRKIFTAMPLSFPELLNYQDYETLNESEIQLYSDAENKLTEQMLDIIEMVSDRYSINPDARIK
ncbi:MAG: hypothetical protein K2L10_06845 [Ruminococcus sp.]|nr:hypothetical protein [Ruminococcus sp.]